MAILNGCETSRCRYQNEAPGYQFYAKASWKSLVPLQSNMADVRRTMGNPSTEKDIADYDAPYPGDKTAKQPVWTYDVDDKWQAIVYFVRSNVLTQREFPPDSFDLLYSIDYLPKEPIRFDVGALPSTFHKSHTVAADAAWNSYTDGNGLIYNVYTSKTPFGRHVPGDLNRIVYGPPARPLPTFTFRGTLYWTFCPASLLPRVNANALEVKHGNKRYMKESQQPFTGVVIGVETGACVVAWQYTYREGILHGEHLHWVNGALYARSRFDRGQYHGTFTSWYPDGTRQTKMNYRHGVVDGWHIDYDQNGRVAEKRFYRDGELIETKTTPNNAAQAIGADAPPPGR